MKRLLTLTLAIALLAGCGRDGATTADDNAGVLVLAIRDEHVSLDPQKISWVADNRIAECLYEPLLKHRVPDLSLEPAAAEGYTVSDDGLVYTFTLRENGRWSNGDPVTAHDFVYAWQRALVPDFAADYTQLLFCIEGAEAFFNARAQQIASFRPGDDANALWAQAQRQFDQTVGIKALDDRTLQVTLRQPTAYFPELCAFVTFMPVHKASVEKTVTLNRDTGQLQRDDKYWSDPDRLVCNGPYRLKQRRFKRDLFVAPNEHYRDRASVKNNGILEKIIGETQTSLLAYQRGEVHWLTDMPSASPISADLIRQQRDDVHLVEMAGVYFYNFNCLPTLPDGSANKLADARVRRALSMAMDRQTIVEKVTRLNQPVVRSFVPPSAIAGYEPPSEPAMGFDPDAARALLAEAGYPGGRGLTGLSILYNTGQGHEHIAQAIQSMWQTHLGVTVTLEGLEVKAFSDRLKRHDFTICRASWFGDYADPTTWLDKMVTGNGNNDCGYSNPAYDALMAQAAAERDPTARFARLREAEALMLADAPMAMIYQYLQIFVSDPKRVIGLDHNAWNRYRLELVEVK